MDLIHIIKRVILGGFVMLRKMFLLFYCPSFSNNSVWEKNKKLFEPEMNVKLQYPVCLYANIASQPSSIPEGSEVPTVLISKHAFLPPTVCLSWW